LRSLISVTIRAWCRTVLAASAVLIHRCDSFSDSGPFRWRTLTRPSRVHKGACRLPGIAWMNATVLRALMARATSCGLCAAGCDQIPTSSRWIGITLRPENQAVAPAKISNPVSMLVLVTGRLGASMIASIAFRPIKNRFDRTVDRGCGNSRPISSPLKPKIAS